MIQSKRKKNNYKSVIESDRIEALESSQALLNWKYGQERLPWSVLFLTGTNLYLFN